MAQISQEQLVAALKQLVAKDKADKKEEEDTGECMCLGPAPPLDAVNSLTDTILLVSTLLLGFVVGTFAMFGYTDWQETEGRWAGWCANRTSVAGAALHELEWCATAQPLSHYFFFTSFWSVMLLGISTLMAVLIKFALFLAQLREEYTSGLRWRVWWYIFMWPLIVCSMLVFAGLGLYLLVNGQIVRLVYPDFATFEQGAASGDFNTVWISAQEIMWGATLFVGALAVFHVVAGLMWACHGKKKMSTIAPAS